MVFQHPEKTAPYDFMKIIKYICILILQVVFICYLFIGLFIGCDMTRVFYFIFLNFEMHHIIEYHLSKSSVNRKRLRQKR